MANIQRTVGSGQQHATIQDAINFFNTKNFVSDGDTGEILIYNDAEWTIGASLTGPTGTTTDATHGLTIRAADGHSFKDHANKLTNPLRYNQSVGVAIRCTATVPLLNLSINHLTLIGLQFANLSVSGTSIIEVPTGAGKEWTIRDCIFRATPSGAGTTYAFANVPFGTFKLINCLAYGCSLQMASNGNDVIAGCTIYNDVNIQDRGAVWINWGTCRVVDTLAYSNGAEPDYKLTPNGGGYAANSRNCGAVDTSGPATNLVQFVAADVFENLGSGTEDFRLKASAPANVKTGGFRIDADNQDLDIIGKARSTTTPSIGAWEVGASFKPQICQTPNGAVMRGITP